LKSLAGHAGPVYAISFSPNGKLLASGSYDKSIKVWDVNSGAALHTFNSYHGCVYSVVFSPDGKQLESSSGELWDVKSGTVLQTLADNVDTRAVFSPDGKQLALALSNTIKVLDINSGVPLHTLYGHASAVNCVQFSSDGRRLTSGSLDRTVIVWDLESEAVLQMLEGHTSSVESVAFSPDGNLIASASYDKTVRVWSARSNTPLQPLRSHNCRYGIDFVSLSTDGKQLISVGSNEAKEKAVKLWDVESGAAQYKLHFPADSLILISPDGKWVASSLRDATI
jgi:WD40 repeat protein